MSRHIFVMPMVLSLASLLALGQGDQNEVKHNVFSHMMPLIIALLSCVANCIINDTISLLGEDDWNKVWHDCFGYVDDVGPSVNITWDQWPLQWHCFVCYIKMIEVRCNLMLLVIWNQFRHHITLMTSSVSPLHLFKMIETRYNMTFLVILNCWH